MMLLPWLRSALSVLTEMNVVELDVDFGERPVQTLDSSPRCASCGSRCDVLSVHNGEHLCWNCYRMWRVVESQRMGWR